MEGIRALFVALFIVKVYGAEHGEPCDIITNPCVPDVLECSNNICECPGESGNESIWSETSQTCFLLEGTTCGPALLSQCTPNSDCRNLKCKCRFPFERNSEGKCYLREGKACNHKHELCDPLLHLVCGEGDLCGCSPGSVFRGADGCVILPGQFCEPPPSDLCAPGTTCVDSRCVCDEGQAIPSPHDPLDINCYLPHSQACSVADDKCDPFSFLECDGVSTTCMCKGEGLTSFYDLESETCFNLADSECDFGGMPCIPNSHCFNNLGTGICQCRYPMTAVDGLCVLEVYEDCDQENDICDKKEHLICTKEIKCGCPEDFGYVPGLGCRILPGQFCEPPPFDLCAPGSACVDSKCACDYPESIPSPHNPLNCYLTHGQSCSPADDKCDPFSFLECDGSSTTCLCKGEGSISTYNLESETCFSLADSECDSNNGVEKMPCVPNSNCLNNSGSEICQCKKPMTAVEGFCTLGINQQCDQTNDLCDKKESLVCTLKNKCGCQKDSGYYSGIGCVIFPGGDCDDNLQAPPCAPSANCTDGICSCINKLAITIPQDLFQCYIGHGIACSPRDQCDPFSFLECDEVSGQCRCKGEGLTTIYDAGNGVCYTLPDFKCQIDGIPCVPSSDCKNETGSQICQCKYPMTKSGSSCSLKFQQPCDQENDFCDKNEHLFCNLENMCECPQGSGFYDGVGCVIFPENQCLIDDQSMPCAPSSTCRVEICSCNNNSSHPNPQDPLQCFLEHGHSCSPRDKCNPFNFLQCDRKTNTCRCEGEGLTSFYDRQSKTCYIKPDTECQKDLGMSCSPTADCIKEGGTSRCHCRYPLTNILGFCELPLGQKCDSTNDMCSERHNLICSLENLCDCPNGSDFFEGIGCANLPGFNCTFDPSEDHICYPGTNCTDGICSCGAGSTPSEENPTFCVLQRDQECILGGNTLCDPFSFLECTIQDFVSKCFCSGENQTTFYDTETETCFLKANQKCHQAPGSQHCTPRSGCLPSTEGEKCICHPGFISNSDGRCFLPHLSKCTAKNDLCDPNTYLTCDYENKCTCGPHAIFDANLNTCVIKALHPCLSDAGNQPCIDNSICSQPEGICTCNPPLKASSNGSCYLEHGLPCNVSQSPDLCNPLKKFTCSLVWGHCLCEGEEEGTSFYNSFLDKCYLLGGSPCSINGSKCVGNSYCDPITGKCRCKGDLIENEFGYCFLSYGDKCEAAGDLCDPDAFLECSTGTCKCQREFETFYDEEAKTCRLIHDRPCNPEPSPDLPHNIQRVQPCDRNAFCNFPAPGNSTHRCKCKDGGFLPNPESICFLPYNQLCYQYPEECDSYGPLECDEVRGRCNCRDSTSYYNENTKKCLTNPGGPCTNSSQQCGDNSECDLEEGVCKCLPSFDLNAQGECRLRYGENCEQGRGLCHGEINLLCLNNTCVCLPRFREHVLQAANVRNMTICYPDYNETCSKPDVVPPYITDFDCSPESNLYCNRFNNTCLCESPVRDAYIDFMRQCRRKNGMPCDINSDGRTETCVPGAECVHIGVGGEKNGRCECMGGYKPLLPNYQFCVKSMSSRFQISQSWSVVSVLCYLLTMLQGRIH